MHLQRMGRRAGSLPIQSDPPHFVSNAAMRRALLSPLSPDGTDDHGDWGPATLPDKGATLNFASRPLCHVQWSTVMARMVRHSRWTTSMLRIDIDSGRSGDKIDWPDPAAVPLGTDDEAAGTPPSPERVELALRQELSWRPNVMINIPRLDAATRFYFVLIIALALVFIGFGFLVARP
jgi:hypothetical protein